MTRSPNLMRTPWDQHTWRGLSSAIQHEIALHREETLIGCAVPGGLHALD